VGGDLLDRGQDRLYGGDADAKWVRRAEVDQGQRPGVTTDERERIKALERENRELRQANEIRHLASAYFAQAELDRRSKS
jgi:transposase-like protein